MTKHWSGALPPVGEELWFASWWTPHQDAIVAAGPGPWRIAVFGSGDTSEPDPSGPGVSGLATAGNLATSDKALPADDDHCTLCWANLNEGQLAHHDGKQWVCDLCFEAFIRQGPPWLR